MYRSTLGALVGAQLSLAVWAKPTESSSVKVDNTQPVGNNPVIIDTARKLGFQTANNSCSHRDLGFTGSIGDRWYAIFGDTLWCKEGVLTEAEDPEGFHGMVRDAVSLLTDDPLIVVDLHMNTDSPVPHQQQFVPFHTEWNETNLVGFGGTSLCETDAQSETAALYYLINSYGPGYNSSGSGLKGAGVARVQVVNGTPMVTERLGSDGIWWNSTSTARYGDVAAYRDEKSDYIYVYGGPPNIYTDEVNGSYIYMARVKASNAFELSKYEYWWGRQQGWKAEVLDTFTDETALLWGTGQGQVVYSPFYETYMFVHLTPFSHEVVIRTAPSPEGPFTDTVAVFTAVPLPNGLVYAGAVHPYLDPTGQTLVISYTNNNNIEVIKVTFRK